MKEPGFSTARAKPVRLGPLMKVASVTEARNLTSPALTAMLAKAAPFLSTSYFPFRVAFIVNNGCSCKETRQQGCCQRSSNSGIINYYANVHFFLSFSCHLGLGTGFGTLSNRPIESQFFLTLESKLVFNLFLKQIILGLLMEKLFSISPRPIFKYYTQSSVFS